MTRNIEYEPVDMGKYRHQVTVTVYPGRIARLFGRQPRERVFVADNITRGYEDCGWYEVPSFKQLSNMSELAYAIARAVRQQQFTESAGGAPTQEGE